MRNSTISGNTATGRGGGIYFFGNGGLILDASTVSGNSSTLSVQGGGGIYFYGATAGTGFVISNSTISGNTAAGPGGGLVVRELENSFAVRNSTITNNVAGTRGGGIAVLEPSGVAAVMFLRNSIVSGNTESGFAPDDLYVSPTVSAHINFSALGSNTGFTPSGISSNNLFGQALHLQPLANNGGATLTHALGAGSAAENAGDLAYIPPPSTDQRGSARVSGGRLDIGSYERVSGSLGAGGTFANVFAPGGATYTLTVTYGDAIGISDSTIGDGDLLVSGPNGYSQIATFVPGSLGGTPTLRTAQYTVSAPGGTFGSEDNGVFSVGVVTGQVTNTANTPVPAGAIGTFRVAVPATIVVTSAADTGTGTLRAAILQANASTGADAIAFGPLFATPQVIGLATALPTIAGSTFIVGPGADLLTVRRNTGAPAFRILTFGGAAGYVAGVSGVTISGGLTAGNVQGTRGGGGIAINGTKTLTIADAVVTGNTASGEGGGIYVGSGGSLTVRDSTISGNTAGTDATTLRVGGGIYLRDGGMLLVESSTISGNASPTFGGGVYAYGSDANPGTLTIRNSTIAGNSAALGAGLAATIASGPHSLTVQNSTIAGNTAATRGGGVSLAFTGGTFATSFVSTVIARNTAPVGPDVDGSVNVSFGLVRDHSGATLPNYATQNNLPANTDPLFVGGAMPTLADNGGSTRTIALQTGSPLLNAGANPTGLATDQRGTGFARFSGIGVDIGAFELQVAPAPTVTGVTVNTGQPDPAQRSRVTSITVTFSTQVTFAGAVADAFGLSRIGGGAVGGFTATANVVGGATVVTLSGFTGAESEFGSLADGRYTVLVRANQVTAGGTQLDGDGNGTGGDDYTLAGSTANGLFRLYGDASGDGTVNAFDFAQLRNAFGSSTGNPAYRDYLDFNADGTVNAFDFGQFRPRFGSSVP